MVSGAGEGLGKAAAAAGTFLSTSALQDQRDKMEMRRLQLMESNDTAREQRGQEFQRGLQQERIGADLLARSQEREHADKTLDRTQDFTASENDKTRQQHKDDQAQALSIAKATLAQGDDRLANDKDHQAATVKLAQAQLDAQKENVTLQPLSDGTFMRVNAQGEVLGRALDPDTHKPLQGTKDLPATTKLMVDINKTMIQFKGEQLKNPSLLPDERSVINADIDRLKQNVEQLLGMAPEKKGPVEIIDPAAKKPGGPETTIAKPPPPAAPAPSAEDYLAQMRQQAAQRADALKAQTQQAGQAAMDADRPGMAMATTPFTEQAPSGQPAPRPLAKMERQAPRRMQEPGEPSEPTGMIAAANPKPSVTSNQPATVPRELPRAAAVTNHALTTLPMQEPEPLDVATGGPPDPFVSNQPANVPRELPRATPRKGMIAAVRAPGITDPDGTQPVTDSTEPVPTDFDGQQATQDAIATEAGSKTQPTSRRTPRPISPENLRSLLTSDQKLAIAKMRERVLKPGKTEKPATPGQLQDLLIKILGPLYRDNGQGPGDLAEGVKQMMNTLLPERTLRR